MPVRIFIVDDHPAILLGLSNMLSEENGFYVVGAFRNGRELQQCSPVAPPDVVLMDIRMPGMSCAECIQRTLRLYPTARILLISSFEAEEEVSRAFLAGASGFLSKNADQEQVVAAIRKVAEGGRSLPVSMAKKLAARHERDTLTMREIEILAEVARGRTNREIAKALGLSEFTVRNHVNHVLSKMQVRDRTEAAVAGFKQGLI